MRECSLCGTMTPMLMPLDSGREEPRCREHGGEYSEHRKWTRRPLHTQARRACLRVMRCITCQAPTIERALAHNHPQCAECNKYVAVMTLCADAPQCRLCQVPTDWHDSSNSPLCYECGGSRLTHLEVIIYREITDDVDCYGDWSSALQPLCDVSAQLRHLGNVAGNIRRVARVKKSWRHWSPKISHSPTHPSRIHIAAGDLV